MLDDLYQDETKAVLDDLQLRPVPRVTPGPDFWAGIASAAPRGAASGGVKVAASQAQLAEAYGNVVGAFDPFGASVINRTDPERVKKERADALKRIETGEFLQSDMADELRRVARSVRPDPETTGIAAQIVSGVAEIGTEAGVSTLLPGGAVAGVARAEMGATFTELRDQGVDPRTAGKVAAIHGFATAANVALPVAGGTLLRTLGLGLVGGPGGFIAENAAARKILKDADYGKLAEQYDPFDPLGLFVSSATAAVFGGMGYRGKVKGRATPEQVDAARVIVSRENDEAGRLSDPADLRSVDADRAAVDRAAEQMALGKRVEVSDTLGVSERAAERTRAIERGEVRPDDPEATVRMDPEGKLAEFVRTVRETAEAELAPFRKEIEAAQRAVTQPIESREPNAVPEGATKPTEPAGAAAGEGAVAPAEGAAPAKAAPAGEPQPGAQHVSAAETAIEANPNLEVEFGDGRRMKIGEALKVIQDEAKAEIADANLFQVAAACAIGSV